jgi:hypothetical protein
MTSLVPPTPPLPPSFRFTGIIELARISSQNIEKETVTTKILIIQDLARKFTGLQNVIALESVICASQSSQNLDVKELSSMRRLGGRPKVQSGDLCNLDGLLLEL